MHAPAGAALSGRKGGAVHNSIGDSEQPPYGEVWWKAGEEGLGWKSLTSRTLFVKQSFSNRLCTVIRSGKLRI